MKFSLKRKTVLLIVAVVVLISVISILISRRAVTEMIRKEYSTRATDLAGTIAVSVDTEKVRFVRDAVLSVYGKTDNKISNESWGTPEFEEYAARFQDIENTDVFRSLKEHLRKIQDANHVDCVYLIYSDAELGHSVYLVDAAYEFNCGPGTFDLFYDEDYRIIEHPEEGFLPMITNTEEYGWHLATAMPIYEAQEIVAYAGVDIDMNEIMGQRDYYIYTLCAAMILGAVLVSLVGIILVQRFIIQPVKVLTEASREYNHDHNREERHLFSNLQIHTGDEIESLASSMMKMEQEINAYIDDLMTTTKELVSSHQREIELDQIANIDSLTRVKNRRAYETKLERMNQDGTKQMGAALIDLNGLKRINDEYGHDRGDIAIQTLCRIVCTQFKHSPVYRIGGDEFAVILEGADLENVEALARQFREQIHMNEENDKLKPWEKGSAAFGYAIYDPAVDTDIYSVIKRADKEMYTEKRKMKETP